MHGLRFLFASLALILALGATAAPAHAQNSGTPYSDDWGTPAAATEPEPEPEVEVYPAHMKAGSFDLALAGGLGALIYPHLEPSFELALMPLGDGISLSVGASIDLGYCLLCGVIGLVASDYSVSSWYFTPMGRANLHLDAFARLLELRELDPYIGFTAGPGYYSFRVTVGADNADYDYNRVTILAGPLIGGRFMMDDTQSWFFFGEARYLLEFGFETIVVNANGGRVYNVGEGITRAGMDIVGGIGMRF